MNQAINEMKQILTTIIPDASVDFAQISKDTYELKFTKTYELNNYDYKLWVKKYFDNRLQKYIGVWFSNTYIIRPIDKKLEQKTINGPKVFIPGTDIIEMIDKRMMENPQKQQVALYNTPQNMERGINMLKMFQTAKIKSEKNMGK